MSSDTAYIEILGNLINETEGKLQEAIKENRYGNGVENIKTVLKYLREKKKELTEDLKKIKK